METFLKTESVFILLDSKIKSLLTSLSFLTRRHSKQSSLMFSEKKLLKNTTTPNPYSFLTQIKDKKIPTLFINGEDNTFEKIKVVLFQH